MEMKEQRFGIEIEMTGLTRQRAAQVLAEYFGRSSNFDGYYENIPCWTARAAVEGHERRQHNYRKKEGRRIVSADNTYSVELVSPICRYEDIETIQEIVRKLRQAGMIANRRCGIHIHLDASPHNAQCLKISLRQGRRWQSLNRWGTASIWCSIWITALISTRKNCWYFFCGWQQ